MTPDQYLPEEPTELIGDARPIATKLLRHLKVRQDAALKVILFGSPGVGKTTIVRMICRKLAKHKVDVEKVNGRNLTIELVREWERGTYYGSLFGGWKVKHVEEVDLIAQVSQDVMLTYLDDLPKGNAVLGTSNLSLDTLTERFQTRFQLIQVRGPSNDVLADWLYRRWRVRRIEADFIALGACGNVREALLAARGLEMFGKTDSATWSTKRPNKLVKDPAKMAAAKKAWETIRERSAV